MFKKEKKEKKIMLYIFITALTNSFQNAPFLSGVMQSNTKKLSTYIYTYIIYIIYCRLSFKAACGWTYHHSFHVRFAKQLLISIYCTLKKRTMLPRASPRAPHLIMCWTFISFIYSSVITHVFNNKVLTISYSTKSLVWLCFLVVGRFHWINDADILTLRVFNTR